ncbi:MAG: flavin reductase [Bacillota bacterium]
MKKWRCRVCGYVHEGPVPPEVCPVCGAPASEFEEIVETAPASGAVSPPAGGVASPMGAGVPAGGAAAPVAPLVPDGEDVKKALFAISYGLFVVASRDGERQNGQTCNTVFQVTGDPPRVAVGLNHRNLTHDLVKQSGLLAITVLGRGNFWLVKHFGFQSGRQADKLKDIDYFPGPRTGCPVVADGVAYLECRVRPEMSTDVGTHTLFVADVLGGKVLRDVSPLTYSDYRRSRGRPDVDDLDTQDVVAALNLEYGANRRYRAQLEDLSFPALVRVLEGVMRTEGDHVDDAVRYLLGRLPQESGLARALLYLKMNLEFEEAARDTYLAFAREVKDPGLREMFGAQARAEMGHVNIFRRLIEEMEAGEFPVVLFCPVCGWEVDFGTSPRLGQEEVCGRCGVRLRLGLERGSWVAVQAG